MVCRSILSRSLMMVCPAEVGFGGCKLQSPSPPREPEQSTYLRAVVWVWKRSAALIRTSRAGDQVMGLLAGRRSWLRTRNSASSVKRTASPRGETSDRSSAFSMIWSCTSPGIWSLTGSAERFIGQRLGSTIEIMVNQR